MSDTQQEQSAGETTELDASQGAYQGEIPESASDYAKEVNALLNEEIDESPSYESEAEPETEVEETTEEVEEVETSEQEEVEEAEEESAPTDKAARYRIKAKNDVERTALALHKANPSWTLEQSIDAAKKLHPETTPEQSTTEESTESLANVETQIAELKEKRKAAIKEFDADAQIEIEDQIEALRDKKLELTVKQRETVVSEEQQFYAEADKFQAQAVELYPDAVKADSALAKEMARIDAELIATDNPLIYDPKKALRVAQMAANNLAIAPRSKSAPAPTVKRVTTRPAMQPASGQTRSTSASAPVLDAISNEDMSLAEYEALAESLR